MHGGKTVKQSISSGAAISAICAWRRAIWRPRCSRRPVSLRGRSRTIRMDLHNPTARTRPRDFRCRMTALSIIGCPPSALMADTNDVAKAEIGQQQIDSAAGAVIGLMIQYELNWKLTHQEKICTSLYGSWLHLIGKWEPLAKPGWFSIAIVHVREY